MQPWQESLFALVSQTPRGIWTAEARLLYDLQKVCVDHEREIYTVDLVEWALSWGRRPIKRQLPHQRDVLMLKHLRSAARLLDAVRLSDQQRRQLAALIHEVPAARRGPAPRAAPAANRRRAGRGGAGGRRTCPSAWPAKNWSRSCSTRPASAAS